MTGLNWRNVPDRYQTENNGTKTTTYQTDYGELYVKQVCPVSETRPVYIRAEFSPDNFFANLKQKLGFDTTQVAEKHDEDIAWDIYPEDKDPKLKVLMEIENETMRPRKPLSRFHNAVGQMIHLIVHTGEGDDK